MSINSKKGFTLIELLIVIAILAILASAVLIVINPAELLKRSRDSKRITDLGTMVNSINLYINDKGAATNLTNDATSNARCNHGTGAATLFYSLPAGTFTSPSVPSWTVNQTNNQGVNGTGWVPIAFNLMSTGSPIPSEPLDPTNSAPSGGGLTAKHLYYVYACDANDLTFEFAANMESALFSASGTQDVESKDGGQIATIYEVGTKLTIQPSSTSTYYYGSE